MMKKILRSVAAIAVVGITLSCGCSIKESSNTESPMPDTGKQEEETKTKTEESKSETYPKAEGVYRLVTYNVGVFQKSGTLHIGTIASMMKEIGADVISLNELDSCTTRTSRQFQLKLFAGAMGSWDYKFAPALPSYKEGSYGIGIASSPSMKVIGKYRLFLPKEDGSEQRALSVIEFDKFVFSSTHIDHKSLNARLSQLATIRDWMKEHFASSGKPVFLLGDLNATPESPTIAELEKDWTIISEKGLTYPANTPTKCIDYVCVLKGTENGFTVEGTSVLNSFTAGDVSVVSDHRPVYVDIKLK